MKIPSELPLGSDRCECEGISTVITPKVGVISISHDQQMNLTQAFPKEAPRVPALIITTKNAIGVRYSKSAKKKTER